MNKAFLSAVISLFLVGCAKEPPVMVGLIGGLTGPTADLGVASRNGMILAIEEWNAVGGMFGQPVRYLAYDDKQQAELAKSASEELIAQKVDFIIGPFTSSMAAVVLPIANEHSVPVMGTTITSTAFTGQRDMLFRLISDTRVSATNYARWLAETYELTSIVLVIDRSNLAFTESWANDFTEVFSGTNTRFRERQYFTSGNNAELMQVATNLTDLEVSLMVMVANAVDSAVLIKTIRELLPDQLFSTSEWAGTSDLFLQLGGIHVEGVLVPRYIDLNNNSPAFQEFSMKYMERFLQPVSFPAMLAYEATNIFLAELKQQGRGAPFIRSLQQARVYTSNINSYELDAYGDEVSNSIHVATQIIDQQYYTLTDLR